MTVTGRVFHIIMMEEAAPSSRIFIRNIPKDFTDKMLEKEMTKVGEVTDCKIRRTKEGVSRGIAYVGFRDIETATEAIKYFDGSYLLNRKISVVFAKPIGAPELDDSWVRHQQGIESSNWNQADDDNLKGKTNRLFVTNIAYETTDEELEEFFSKYGEVVDAHLPMDTVAQRAKGYAIITFASPDSVEAALSEAVVMKGRHLQLKRGEEVPEHLRRKNEVPDDDESFKDKKKRLLKEEKPRSWNALFLNKDTIVEATAAMLGFTKAQIMNPESNDLATRRAIAESQLTNDTRAMFEQAGIDLAAFENPDYKPSRTLIIAKNLKYKVTEEEIKNMFAAYGSLVRFIYPPTHGSVLVEYARPEDARKAFKALNYHHVLDQPMLLQWAPAGATGSADAQEEEGDGGFVQRRSRTSELEAKLKTTTLMMKNVPFKATKKELYDIVNTYARVKGIRMPKKADESGHRGFAFLDFNTKQEAAQALENLRNVHLYDRHLVVQPAEKGRSVDSLAQTDE